MRLRPAEIDRVSVKIRPAYLQTVLISALSALLTGVLAFAAVAETRPGGTKTGNGGESVLMAQAEIPIPRERPLLVEPPAASPLNGAAGAPLDLLKGLSLSPGGFDDPAALDRPDQQLHVAARLSEEGQTLNTGLIWRVYKAQPTVDGTFELVEESEASAPIFTLPADDYIVHVAWAGQYRQPRFPE